MKANLNRFWSAAMLVGALWLYAPAAEADVAGFTDSFEGAVFDPFWTVQQQFGTVQPFSGVSVSGLQSARFASSSGGQRELHLGHVFPEAVKGLFTIWFYDSAPGMETLYAKLALSNSSQMAWNTAVGTQDFDAGCYSAVAAGAGQNANCGIYPQLATTSVARTLGWHKFEIDVGLSSLSVLIDGLQVVNVAGDYSFDTVDFYLAGPSSRPNTVAYYDDFSFDPLVVPEPSSGLLLVGGLGLVWLGRRGGVSIRWTR